MKPVILFVDDDLEVLDALRERLHRVADKWEIFFVDHAEAALDRLSCQKVDVMVTDLRLPDIDGLALLQKVRDQYPDVIRVVLSGDIAQDSSLGSAAVAHRFLEKPCPSGVLEGVLVQSLSLRSVIQSAAVRSVVARAGSLPPLPEVYCRLQECLHDDETSVAAVAAVLKQDMALCAKMLQLVNSAFFRRVRSISSVEEAVSYLGLNTVRHVVLAAGLFEYHRNHPGVNQSLLDGLQRHALLTAEAAVKRIGDRDRDTAFVAGLLHDVGKLVLFCGLPVEMKEVAAEQQRSGGLWYQAERTVLGVSHAEVGGYLLSLWGLPYVIIDAVVNHHEVSAASTGECSLCAILSAANAEANKPR